jgi:hemoglobin
MSGGPVRPAPTGDLDSPEEIAEMVRRFYQDVTQDDLLGPVFNDVAAVDWNEHLPKLAAFWNRALLGIEGYAGNPFRAHALINQRSPFTQAHFDRWLELFHDAVELGWTGPMAERALALAHNVARVHAGQLVAETPAALALVPSGAPAPRSTPTTA